MRDTDQQMEDYANVQCPFCAQQFELSIDTTQSTQQFITDCEVCCRPFLVTAECEPGEVVSVRVDEN